MLAVGFALGVVSRLLDRYTQNLGNMFSQLAIWILFGVLITLYSRSQKKAMGNVFFFCIGMLSTYYLVAWMTDGVYSEVMIVGWTVFAFCSPVFAFFTWLTKGNGIVPNVIRVGILLVSLLTSILLFDGLRIYDVIINGVLFYFLFFKKVER